MLFPVALESLKRLVRYWCHCTRFPYFGAAYEEEKDDDDEYAEPSEESFYRFLLDVIEDREGLAHLDSLGIGDPTWLWLLEPSIWHSRPGIKIRTPGVASEPPPDPDYEGYA